MFEETLPGIVASLSNDQILEIQKAADEEAGRELSRIGVQLGDSTSFILFGFTHGGRLKEKVLYNQLACQYNHGLGVMIVPKWSVIEDKLKRLDIELHELAVECYVARLFETIISQYPTLLCGVISDANLGWVGRDKMTAVVKTFLANHPRIQSLRLFTGTPQCADEATAWAHNAPEGACYKLSSEQCIGEHRSILHCIQEQYLQLIGLPIPDVESSDIEVSCSERKADLTILRMRGVSNDSISTSGTRLTSMSCDTTVEALSSLSSDSVRSMSEEAITFPPITPSATSASTGRSSSLFFKREEEACVFPTIDRARHPGTGL